MASDSKVETGLPSTQPPLDPPPTYSTTAHTDSQASTPTPLPTSSTQKLPYILELHHTTSPSSASLNIVEGATNSTLYFISPHTSPNYPDLILHAGYDAHGPQLALADGILQQSREFKVYVGGLKTPSDGDWDIIREVSGGGGEGLMAIFKGIGKGEDRWRFEIAAMTTATNTTPGSKMTEKVYWTKTSEKKLGASKFSPRDHKLVDQTTEEVVATYIESHLGDRQVKGEFRFMRRLGAKGEIQAVMVLMGLLEKSRRYMRNVKRAFPNTNGF